MFATSFRLALAPMTAAFGLYLGTVTAQAADASGNFAVRGLGSQTCATYVEAIAKPEEFARYGNWLLGYATAQNRTTPDTYDVIPTEPSTDFPNVVAVVCRTNPQILLENAAASAISVMKPLRQRATSPLIQFSVDGKAVAIRQDSLKRLQTALITKQMFKGTANGASSAAFTDALKAFQRKEGIPVTGLPDIDTFIRAIVKR